MALALKADVHMHTHDEYLAMEKDSETKNEYFKGQIFAMSVGSVNHSRIAVNLMVELGNSLHSASCEPFNSDLRTFINAYDLFTYPDISVICGAPEFYQHRTDTITNPIVIFEVLSPSTKDYDRGQKFEFYRSIPSLRDYVIVHQDKVVIEHHHKVGINRWLLTEYTSLEDTLLLESIGAALPTSRVYARVSELGGQAASGPT